MESIFHYDHHCHLPDPDDLVVIREGCVSFRLESAHHRLLMRADNMISLFSCESTTSQAQTLIPGGSSRKDPTRNHSWTGNYKQELEKYKSGLIGFYKEMQP